MRLVQESTRGGKERPRAITFSGQDGCKNVKQRSHAPGPGEFQDFARGGRLRGRRSHNVNLCTKQEKGWPRATK